MILMGRRDNARLEFNQTDIRLVGPQGNMSTLLDLVGIGILFELIFELKGRSMVTGAGRNALYGKFGEGDLRCWR